MVNVITFDFAILGPAFRLPAAPAVGAVEVDPPVEEKQAMGTLPDLAPEGLGFRSGKDQGGAPAMISKSGKPSANLGG